MILSTSSTSELGYADVQTILEKGIFQKEKCGHDVLMTDLFSKTTGSEKEWNRISLNRVGLLHWTTRAFPCCNLEWLYSFIICIIVCCHYFQVFHLAGKKETMVFIYSLIMYMCVCDFEAGWITDNHVEQSLLLSCQDFRSGCHYCHLLSTERQWVAQGNPAVILDRSRTHSLLAFSLMP